jgi:hypothetical protein
MIVELTLLPIAMVVVFLRMWVRIAWLKKSWYDDYLMMLAMVITLFRMNERMVVLTSPGLLHRNNNLSDNGLAALRMGQACLGLAPSNTGARTKGKTCTTCVTVS